MARPKRSGVEGGRDGVGGGKGPGLGEEEGGGHAKQILILQGGIESRQLQCRFQVLTIGPPGSSLIFAFSNSLVSASVVTPQFCFP